MSSILESFTLKKGKISGESPDISPFFIRATPDFEYTKSGVFF